MSTADLFGLVQAPAAPFRDIRNQRDSVAEEKAMLVLQLNELAKRVPASVNAGSTTLVRAWLAYQQRSLKVLKSMRSSRAELTTRIAQMRTYLA